MLKLFFLGESLIIFFAVFVFTSCQHRQEIPFPEELAENTQPQTFPLEFTDPKPVHWDTIGKEVITPKVFPLDFKKLKGMDYDSSGFKPLAFPVTQSTFNYETLPSRMLNLEGMTKHPLRIKTAVLPFPVAVSKMHKPERVLQTTTDMSIWQQISQLNIIVFGIDKDKAGFIWLATDNGIFRFDGTTLVKMIPGVFCYDLSLDKNGNLWYLDATDIQHSAYVKVDFIKNQMITYSTDIPVSSITGIVADKEGRIWKSGSATSPPALLCPDEKIYYSFDNKAGFNSSRYYNIILDNNNLLWCASRKGIEIIDLNSNKVIQMNRSNGLSTDSVDAFIVGPDGKIWAAGMGVLDAIDIKSGKIFHYKYVDNDKGQRVFSMLFDKKGQLWLGRRTDLSIVDFSNNSVRHITRADGMIYNENILDIVEYSTGQILVSGFSGRSVVYAINQYGKTVFPFRNTPILSTIEDSKGNLWVGTEKELFVVDSSRNTYWRLTENNGLANASIQSVTERNGKIVITTNEGYNIYNPQKSEWIRVGKKEGLQINPVYSFLEDHKGNYWITGSASEGILKYNPTSGYLLNLNSKGGLNGNFVMQATTIIGNDNIWMLTSESGPNIINTENNTIQFIKNIPGLDTVSSKSITIDSHGRIWITGTPDYGLYMIDLKSKQVVGFNTNKGLIDNSTNSILEYKGRMIVCANQNVSIITPPELSLRHYWEINLLRYSEGFKKSSNSFVSDAITKRGNYLWGDLGLGIIYGIEPDTSRSTNYITAIRINGKDVVFTNQQKNSDTTQQKSNTSLPTTEYVEKGKIRWDSLSGPYRLPINLSLPNDQNIVRFSFSEISSGRQDDLQFAYILEGIDKKWSFTKELQTETYLNLSPGDYTFKVASRWQNGKWNTPATFSFTIRAPWYATWWAYLLYLILALGIIRGYIIFRSRKFIRENKLLEEKVKHRTNLLQDSIENLKSTQTQLVQSEKMASLGELTAGIAHEIQNPLNFINNFSEVNKELLEELKDEVNKGNINEAKAIANDVISNEEKINHHGKRADAIVKGMLQHSRSSSGQKEFTDINALCDEYLRLSYHGLRAKDKTFNAKFETDFDNTIEKIDIIPQDIGRVILNLINNAFYAVSEKKKTAGASYEPTVTISTKNESDKVLISIADNGSGIPSAIKDKIFQPFFTTKPTGSGTGLGLSLAYDIITKGHGGELLFETYDGYGSTFKIKIPVL